MAHSRTSCHVSLMEPNPPLRARTTGFYPNVALDSRPSLESPDTVLGVGRTGVCGRGYSRSLNGGWEETAKAGRGALRLPGPLHPCPLPLGAASEPEPTS